MNNQNADKVNDSSWERPILAVGVAIIAGGIAALAMTGGLALPIAAPIITLGTTLINTYAAGKSAAVLATDVALPVISTVTTNLMSSDQATVKATITLHPPTSRRDELESAIIDADETKPVADTDAPETEPSPDHEPPSLG